MHENAWKAGVSWFHAWNYMELSQSYSSMHTQLFILIPICGNENFLIFSFLLKEETSSLFSFFFNSSHMPSKNNIDCSLIVVLSLFGDKMISDDKFCKIKEKSKVKIYMAILKKFPFLRNREMFRLFLFGCFFNGLNYIKCK